MTSLAVSVASPIQLHLRRRQPILLFLQLLLLLLLRPSHDVANVNAFALSHSPTTTATTRTTTFTSSTRMMHWSRHRRSTLHKYYMSSSSSSSNENEESNNGEMINDDEDELIASSSSSLSRQEDNNNQLKAPNPYLAAIATPPPSDLISQFANTASPRAKDAARATIAGLMGGLTSNMMNGGGGQKGGGASGGYEDGFTDNSSSTSGGGGVMDARGGGNTNNENTIGFTSKIVATGARLANLMFQLQMTGYMLRNAEYRIELGRSLGSSSSSSSSEERSSSRTRMLPSQLSSEVDTAKEDELVRQRRGRIVKGTKIKVRYGGSDDATGDDEVSNNENEEDDGNEEESSPFMGLEVEVDAKAYVSELRGEIKRLRDAIESTRRAKEEEVEQDLLMYIRSLPPQELQQLTGTMSPEVLEAMKGLVSAVLAGIGEEEEDDTDEDGRGVGGDGPAVRGATSAIIEGDAEVGADQSGNTSDDGRKGTGIGPNTVTEQSGEALARLCMWQLVVGYNLREMEVREKLRASMEDSAAANTSATLDGDSEGRDLFGPGVLE